MGEHKMSELFSKETEETLIGQLLLEPDAFGKLEMLKPEHFYSSKLGKVYKSICIINSDGGTADLLAVHDNLKKSKQIETVGGYDYLVDLFGHEVSSAMITANEKRIVDYWKKREILKCINQIASTINESDLDETQSRLFSLLQSFDSNNTTGFRPSPDVAKDFIDYFNDLLIGKSTIPTGFIDLDDLLNSGLKPGDYLIIAAATSMGKTSLGLNIARNMAEKGYPVGIVSLEMTGAQLYQRLVFSKSKIKFQKINTKNFSKIKISNIGSTVNIISKLPIFIDDSGCSEFGQLLSRMTLQIRKNKLKVIFIDYLQLLRFQGENRNLEVQAISGGLKRLALKEKISIVAMSQLNRKTGDDFPKLANLRDSGAIEQDADAVLFIFRPEQIGIEQFEGKSTKNLALCHLAKNRNGPTGKFKLTFLKELASFS